MRAVIVAEFHDQRMTLENGLHDRALNADAASVHEADFAQARLPRRAKIFVDDRRHISRCECVEIELGSDWDDDGRIVWRTGRVFVVHFQTFPLPDFPTFRLPDFLGSFVPGDHFGRNAPAGRERTGDGHAARLTRGDQVVENSVDGGLVEDALVAVAEEVVLQCLQLDTRRVGHVLDDDLAEIREPRFGAHRGELGAADVDVVVAFRARVGEGLDGGHRIIILGRGRCIMSHSEFIDIFSGARLRYGPFFVFAVGPPARAVPRQSLNARPSQGEYAMADARRMGKMELFAHFAEKFDMKRTQVRDLFDELLRLSEKELKRSGEFVLPGMCKLVVQRRKAREGRNPATGEPIKIPAKTVVKARIAKQLKDAVLPRK